MVEPRHLISPTFQTLLVKDNFNLTSGRRFKAGLLKAPDFFPTPFAS
jgi:hypothetical protein